MPFSRSISRSSVANTSPTLMLLLALHSINGAPRASAKAWPSSYCTWKKSMNHMRLWCGCFREHGDVFRRRTLHKCIHLSLVHEINASGDYDSRHRQRAAVDVHEHVIDRFHTLKRGPWIGGIHEQVAMHPYCCVAANLGVLVHASCKHNTQSGKLDVCHWEQLTPRSVLASLDESK